MKSNTQRLAELIEQAGKLATRDVTSSDPEFVAWHTSVQRLLNRMFGEGSYEAKEFDKTSFTLHIFTSGTPYSDWVDACRSGISKTKAVLKTYLEDYGEVEQNNAGELLKEPSNPTRVFVVHGHDGELRESVSRLLENQGIEPVILFEQANRGNTIIEKFEGNSDVDAAICLFTADDIAGHDEGDIQKRARQNVVLETGFFIGRLGREHVIILADNGVDMPSDLDGVLYINTASWQLALLRDLDSMGFDVDLNQLLNG